MTNYLRNMPTWFRLSVVVLCFCIISNSVLIAQKNIRIVEPDEPIHNTFYNEFKDELEKDNNSTIAEELKNYSAWERLKDYHGKTDSVTNSKRHDYYEKSNIDFYIEVFQSNKSIDYYKNEVYLYADTVVYKFVWYSKKGEINNTPLRYNMQKVTYCIKNNIKQKDLVIVTFTNKISDQNIREDFTKFPDSFVSRLKTMDAEIASRYAFKPLNKQLEGISEASNLNKFYDVQMDITVRLEEEHVKVIIELNSDLSLDEPYFNNTIRYQNVLDDFSSTVARQFIDESKNWLLKD